MKASENRNRIACDEKQTAILLAFTNKEYANFKYSLYWALESDPKDMFCEQMVIWLWYENIKSLPIIEPRFPGCFQASGDQSLDQALPQADVLILPSPETSSWSSQAPPAWAWTWRWWSGQWCWSATCSPTPAWTSSPPGLCSHSPLLNQGVKKMLVHRHMLYFWNPNDSLIPNMMIDTSPLSPCSRQSSKDHLRRAFRVNDNLA